MDRTHARGKHVERTMILGMRVSAPEKVIDKQAQREREKRNGIHD